MTTILIVVDSIVGTATLPACVSLFRGRASTWWGTGRHISRVARRTLRGGSCELFRGFLAVYLIVGLLFDEPGDSRMIVRIVFNAWIVDDYFFGDRPRRRRLRAWAKAKFQKTKPVMRRLAERWKPAPPRFPVPA